MIHFNWSSSDCFVHYLYNQTCYLITEKGKELPRKNHENPFILQVQVKTEPHHHSDCVL